jgi:hypothetical protein
MIVRIGWLDASRRLSLSPYSVMLTLRSTGLSRDPNGNDWSICEDGVQIGRLYEEGFYARRKLADLVKAA